MSVHCDNPDWVKLSKDILKETGAEDIASASEASADFAKSDKPMPRRATHQVDEGKHDKLSRLPSIRNTMTQWSSIISADGAFAGLIVNRSGFGRSMPFPASVEGSDAIITAKRQRSHEAGFVG